MFGKWYVSHINYVLFLQGRDLGMIKLVLTGPEFHIAKGHKCKWSRQVVLSLIGTHQCVLGITKIGLIILGRRTLKLYGFRFVLGVGGLKYGQGQQAL